VAIVGAGPAGMSAAYFLAKAGFEPEIFEAKANLGGMVGGAVPRYRLDDQALTVDLRRLRDLGVKVHLGKALGRELKIGALRREFPYVFLGPGAQRGKRLGIEGENAQGVIDALEFLDKVRAKESMALGTRILIVGGGNSAMDAARSAKRLAKDAQVSLVYRRTRAEMPADPEEVHDCLLEGIGLLDLFAPTRVVVEGGKVVGLACTPMKLGAPDASGRPRPIPVEGREEILPADTIIPAIGQEAMLDFLEGLELERHRDGTLKIDPDTCEPSLTGRVAGGDVARGPASVIKAIADGRAAAEEIGRRHGVVPRTEPSLRKGISSLALLEKKARKAPAQTVPVLPVEARGGFEEVIHGLGPDAAVAEAQRCLDCDDLCSLCVTVCPNRANRAYSMAPMTLELPTLVVRGGALVQGDANPFVVSQGIQILNLGDFCNACGNCASFCPTSGAPFRAKPQFWLDPEAFAEASGDAYRLLREGEVLRLEARLGGELHSLTRHPHTVEYRTESLVLQLDPGTFALRSWNAVRPLKEGEAFNLQILGTLLALLSSEPVFPN